MEVTDSIDWNSGWQTTKNGESNAILYKGGSVLHVGYLDMEKGDEVTLNCIGYDGNSAISLYRDQMDDDDYFAQNSSARRITKNLVDSNGDGAYHDYVWTAPTDCKVMLCGRNTGGRQTHVYLKKNPNLNYIRYFSQAGNDDNDGLTESTTKKNPLPFIEQGGYEVRLKGGDIFYLERQKPLNVGSGTTIKSYGSGMGHICGLQESINAFEKVGQNVYRIILDDTEKDICFIQIDGETKYKRIIPYTMNGVTYYESVQAEGEYLYDAETHSLTYYTTENVAGKKIWYTPTEHSLFVKMFTRDVTIDGIEISYMETCVYHDPACENVTVKNCYMHHAGGDAGYAKEGSTPCKAGNALHCWSNGNKNLRWINNRISHAFDTGICVQNNDNHYSEIGMFGPVDVLIKGNVVSDCYWNLEFFNRYNPGHRFDSLVIEDNVSVNARDITEGYRCNSHQRESTCFVAWDFMPEDHIIFMNNVMMDSENNVIDVHPEAQQTNETWSCWEWDNNIAIGYQENTGNGVHDALTKVLQLDRNGTGTVHALPSGYKDSDVIITTAKGDAYGKTIVNAKLESIGSAFRY